MADRPTRLRVEALEYRRLLSAAPVLDLNGAAPGGDFAVERVDGNGLVALVSHDLSVSDVDSTQLASATVTIAAHLAGDTLGALTHGTNITAAYADGVLQLTGTDSLANYQQVLRTVRFNSTATRNVGDQVDVSFVVSDGQQTSSTTHSIVTVIPQGTATVASRLVFYNHSKYDGDDPAAGASDDLAIAADKQALLQGQTATLANYTNYYRGINGLMIDIAGPHGQMTANDFIFQVGNNNQPDTWLDAPSPVSITIRAGAGQGGSDRVEIIWADGAITNQWLQVRVAANTHTGLATPDTFLFGNSTGESGNSTADARVTVADVARVVNRLARGQTTAVVGDPLDFSRDGRISPQDVLLAAHRIITNSPDVNLINVAPIAPDQQNSTTSTGIIVTSSPTTPFHLLVLLPPTIDGHEVQVSSVNVEPTAMTLRLPYALSTVEGTHGAHSALNLANYRLLKDGVEQPAAIASAAIHITRSSPSQQWDESDITLTFAAPLGPGEYRIVALGTIYDESGHPMDGAQSSTPGSDYSTPFIVAPLVRHGDSSVVTQAPVYAQAVASTPGGDYVVAWAAYGPNSTYLLYVQHVSAAHVPLGQAQLVAQYSTPDKLRLAVDGAGNVTVLWSDNGILARRYAADLTPLGDVFRVDPPDEFGGYLSIDDNSLDVTTGPQGQMIVSWIVQGFNLPNQLLARRFDASGQPLGDPVTLATDITIDAASPPRIAADAAGNLAAVWTELDALGQRLVGRLFDAAGAPRGPEFTIRSSTDGKFSQQPSIVMSPSGEFVVAWQLSLDSHTEIVAQRFDAAGQPLGDTISVDSDTNLTTAPPIWTVGSPQLVLNGQGGFTMVWQASRPGTVPTHNDTPIPPVSVFYARVYDSTGHALTGPSLVTTDEFSDPRQTFLFSGPYVPTAAIAPGADGQLMVVWAQNDTNGATLRAQTWEMV